MIKDKIQNDQAFKDQVIRRLNSLEKKLDLLYADREILESIQGRLTGMEEQQHLTRQHDNEVRKDIKEEINLSGDRTVAKVETKVEEIQDEIGKKKTITIKTKGWIDKILGR